MRVIAGRARGSKLSSLEGLATRPTTDRVKESMFNVLMPHIRGSIALDLFAGSGALGIEALSRGAEKCTFVDVSREATGVIRKNLEHTRLLDDAEIFTEEADRFLGRTGETYSLIFLDPPYKGGLYTPILSGIQTRRLLQEDGIIVLEKEAGEEIILPEGFVLLKAKKYGNTEIWILKIGGKEND